MKYCNSNEISLSYFINVTMIFHWNYNDLCNSTLIFLHSTPSKVREIFNNSIESVMSASGEK